MYPSCFWPEGASRQHEMACARVGADRSRIIRQMLPYVTSPSMAPERTRRSVGPGRAFPDHASCRRCSFPAESVIKMNVPVQALQYRSGPLYRGWFGSGRSCNSRGGHRRLSKAVCGRMTAKRACRRTHAPWSERPGRPHAAPSHRGKRAGQGLPAASLKTRSAAKTRDTRLRSRFPYHDNTYVSCGPLRDFEQLRAKIRAMPGRCAGRAFRPTPPAVEGGDTRSEIHGEQQWRNAGGDASNSISPDYFSRP